MALEADFAEAFDDAAAFTAAVIGAFVAVLAAFIAAFGAIAFTSYYKIKLSQADQFAFTS